MVEDAALFSAWFAALADAGVHNDGCLHLIAPTRFQARYIRTHLLARLQHAVEAVDPSVRGVEVRDA